MQEKDIQIIRKKLSESFLLFLTTFFKIKTGREFKLSKPIGRESHYITIARELEKVFRLETNRLIINVPPGHAKSTMFCYFIAWAIAQYPDSNFLYISYSYDLAEKHTATIKEIISLPFYKLIFGVELQTDSKAKGAFKTTKGGAVKAFGSAGTITGQDAGLPNLIRFSGAVIIDDAHKPDEVHSDTLRQKIIDNYNQTVKPRPRGPNVPLLFIGQRLHEDDLAAFLIEGRDGYKWDNIILKALDDSGNALCPNINTVAMLQIEQEVNPYVFASQYQQNPQPSGGGIFKPEWFVILNEEPKILETFITLDTAESNKDHADYTVFSFWGVYKLIHKEVMIGKYGLHWIDSHQVRVEPKDLESEFFQFWADCMRHSVKPKVIAIEKKSTGVTMASVLKEVQGMRIIDIERTKASGSKASRYFEAQKYVAAKQISLPSYGRHTETCIEHCRKITANNTHRHDDIADTLYDAVKLALIDGAINPGEINEAELVMEAHAKLAGQYRYQSDFRGGIRHASNPW